jgi:hypothetical protein
LSFCVHVNCILQNSYWYAVWFMLVGPDRQLALAVSWWVLSTFAMTDFVCLWVHWCFSELRYHKFSNGCLSSHFGNRQLCDQCVVFWHCTLMDSTSFVWVNGLGLITQLEPHSQTCTSFETWTCVEKECKLDVV